MVTVVSPTFPISVLLASCSTRMTLNCSKASTNISFAIEIVITCSVVWLGLNVKVSALAEKSALEAVPVWVAYL